VRDVEERQWPREVMERVNGGATITWWRGTAVAERGCGILGVPLPQEGQRV